MVDIFDLLIHVNGHGSDNFAYVLCALLVVLFHQTVFLQYTFWYRFQLDHLWLNLISLMPELLILLFQMLN